MNIRDLIHIIDGTLITPPANPNRIIKGGFGADLMSDVLASIQPEAVLVTGLWFASSHEQGARGR